MVEWLSEWRVGGANDKKKTKQNLTKLSNEAVNYDRNQLKLVSSTVFCNLIIKGYLNLWFWNWNSESNFK